MFVVLQKIEQAEGRLPALPWLYFQALYHRKPQKESRDGFGQGILGNISSSFVDAQRLVLELEYVRPSFLVGMTIPQ